MTKDIQYYFEKNQKTFTNQDFKQVYQLASTQLYGVILRILKSRELSEECLQEVFVKIYHNLQYYDSSKAKALTWMSTIARNYAIDFYRKKSLNIADDFDLDIISDGQIQTLQKIEASENKSALIKCLKQIKNHEKQAIYMVYYQNYNYEQVAQNFNKSINTVKSWVVRVMPKLKKCLEKIEENNYEK